MVWRKNSILLHLVQLGNWYDSIRSYKSGLLYQKNTSVLADHHGQALHWHVCDTQSASQPILHRQNCRVIPKAFLKHCRSILLGWTEIDNIMQNKFGGLTAILLLAVVAIPACQESANRFSNLNQNPGSNDSPTTDSLDTADSSANQRSVNANGSLTNNQNLANSSPVQSPILFWQQVLETYSKLDAYSDQAEVNLQYRMGGQLIVESQPLRLSFDRSSRCWQSDAFRAKTIADKSFVVTSILELATNNMDNQIKIVSQGPNAFSDFFSDPIAQVYLSGATDFPINQPKNDWPSLYCPQLSLLLAAGCGPEYLTTSQLQYAGNSILRDHRCTILQSGNSWQSTQFWVDSESYLVRRIVLANQVLDAQLAETPNISDLQVSIDLNDIQTNENYRAPESIKISENQKAVRQFVKVPEAFPSTWIGQPSPEINFSTTANAPWKLSNFLGRPIAAVFVPFSNDLPQWQATIETFAKTTSHQNAELVLAPVASSDQSPDQIAEYFRNRTKSNATAAVDGWKTWSKLRLSGNPKLVIWDGHGVIQYVNDADLDELGVTLEGILSRLANGQSIANEMTRNYQDFFQGYLAALNKTTLSSMPATYYQKKEHSDDDLRGTVSVNSTARNPASDSSATDFTLVGTGVQSPSLFRISQASADDPLLPTSKKWRLDWSTRRNFPQQISWVQAAQSQQLWVLDGFRTIERFDEQGVSLGAIQLNLPEKIGVSKFLTHVRHGQSVILGYNPGDANLYCLSEQGDLLHTYSLPSNSTSNLHSQIVDAQIVDVAENQNPGALLFVAAQGLSGNAATAQSNGCICAFDFNGSPRAPVQIWPVADAVKLQLTSHLDPNLAASGIGLAITAKGNLVGLLPNGNVRTIATTEYSPNNSSKLIGAVHSNQPNVSWIYQTSDGGKLSFYKYQIQDHKITPSRFQIPSAPTSNRVAIVLTPQDPSQELICVSSGGQMVEYTLAGQLRSSLEFDSDIISLDYGLKISPLRLAIATQDGRITVYSPSPQLSQVNPAQTLK